MTFRREWKYYERKIGISMTETMNSKDMYGRILGHLEEDILNLLWLRGSLPGKEIFISIRQTRQIALSTVLTVLGRLCKKGLVLKEKGKSGSLFLFTPALTKDELTKRISDGVFRRLLEISASGATASFIDLLAEADPEELERLKALIDSKRAGAAKSDS